MNHLKIDSRFFCVSLFAIIVFASNSFLFCYGDTIKPDYYGGAFQPLNSIILTDGELCNVSFILNPIESFSDIEVHLILPEDLLVLEKGPLTWVGNIEKETQMTINYTIRSNGVKKANIRVQVTAKEEGIVIENSYYLSVWNGEEYRPVRDKISPTDDVGTSSLSIMRAASGTVEIVGRFMYIDEDGIYQPARFVDLWLYDEDTVSNDDYLGYTYTDLDGYYSFTAILNEDIEEGTLDPYIWVSADNDYARTVDAYGVLYEIPTATAWNVNDGVYDFGELHFTIYNEAWQAIDAVLDEVVWIYSETGYTRDSIDINWPVGDWPGSWGDSIDLPEKNVASWDRTVLYHEFGHCIMYEIYGNSWPPGDGGPHYVWSEIGEGFAVTEGWAEFFECAVPNDPDNLYGVYNGHGGNIETNDWYQVEDEGEMDGALVEGSIASILWDIYDPANDDTLDLGFDEIWEIFYTYNPDSIHDFWNAWNSLGYGYRSGLNTVFWTYGIDKNEAPSTVIVSPNIGGWYSDTVRLEAVSSDVDGVCTEVEIEYNQFTDDLGDPRWTSIGSYSLTSDSWYLDWDSGAITSSTFYFRARTSDGLEWGEWDTNDIPIGIDNIPPEPPVLIEDHSGTTWTSHDSPNYYWNVPTELGSGVQYYEVNIDGVTTMQTGTTYHPTLVEGVHTCQVRAIDNADNIGAWSNTVTVQIDTTPPTGGILIENGELYTDSPQVTISLESSDPGGSGVTEYSLSPDGENWGPWHPITSTTTSVLSGDGEKTVYVKYRDQALVESLLISDTITLDETNPEAPGLIEPGNNQIVVDFRPQMSWDPVTDITSGVAGYVLEYDKVNTFDSPDYTLISSQATSYTSVSDLEYGAWYWRVQAIDYADNVGDWSETWSFTIPRVHVELSLGVGWNTVSFPVILADSSTDAVFQSLDYVIVYEYFEGEYIVPTSLEPGKGYWLFVLEDTVLTVGGEPVESETVQLNGGWNLIGAAYSSSNVDTVLSGYYQVYTWITTEYVSVSSFEPGQAYWVLVLKETPILLP